MSEITTHTGHLDASGLRVAIVATRFNEAIVERLVASATDTLRRHGAEASAIRVVWVPGAFELPIAVSRVARRGDVDAVVALGCVVRGDTPHFDYVAGEAARGTAAAARETDIPVAFGVLTTDTWEQAVARAGGKLGNKGGEAAVAAVETANLLRSL